MQRQLLRTAAWGGGLSRVVRPRACPDGARRPCAVARAAAAAAAATPRGAFHVLGIETSCDDSAIAVVNGATDEVVYQALASQWADHAPYGGIVPNLAARAHDRNVPILLADFMTSGLAGSVDAIAVTRGPGIKPCLHVGLSAARRLAAELGKPLIMVNHLQAHALVARLDAEGGGVVGGGLAAAATAATTAGTVGSTNSGRPAYPFLSLVVSGGHSLLALVEAYDDCRLLGSTLDDSVGEAFDKVARLLQLPGREFGDGNSDGSGGGDPKANAARHGGALVEQAAALSQNHRRFPLPVPLSRRHDDCDFSFAGLKTAVRYALIREHQRESSPEGADALPPSRSNDFRGTKGVQTVPVTNDAAADMAWAFQHAATCHLQKRLGRAVEWVATGRRRRDNDNGKGEEVRSSSNRRSSNISNSSSSSAAPTVIRDVVICGGVASNQHIRAALTKTVEDHGLRAWFPPPPLCVDNGVMIAFAGVEHVRAHPELLDPAAAADGARKEHGGTNGGDGNVDGNDTLRVSHSFPDPRGDSHATAPLARWLFPR